jgi:hypothetical protein
MIQRSFRHLTQLVNLQRPYRRNRLPQVHHQHLTDNERAGLGHLPLVCRRAIVATHRTFKVVMLAAAQSRLSLFVARPSVL